MVEKKKTKKESVIKKIQSVAADLQSRVDAVKSYYATPVNLGTVLAGLGKKSSAAEVSRKTRKVKVSKPKKITITIG